MIRAARQGRRFLLFWMQENGVSVRITGESAFEKTAGGESMTKKQYGDEAERLAPSLRRIAYSIVRNEHDTQDAVQQALLSVWARR